MKKKNLPPCPWSPGGPAGPEKVQKKKIPSNIN